MTLWEALYGVRPFDARSLPSLLLAITSSDLQAPPRRDVPRWLRDVLVRGLQPSPEDRWPSMEALIDALGRDPTRRRRRVAAVGIIAAVMLGGVGLYYQDRLTTASECARSGDAIDGVWNEERLARIAAVFVATDMPHASTTLAKARPWIDAWVESWRSAQDTACRATMLDGVRSAELLALSRECLDDRRVALEVLLESLEQPGGAVSGAVDSAVSLPQVAPCLDDVWLRRQPKRPDDPQQAERLLDLRRTLARAEVAYMDARFGESGELARGALASIEAIEGRPFEARARSLLGNSLRNGGLAEEALVELEAAYFAGLRSGDPEAATDAAMEMMHVQAVELRRHDQALHWGRLTDVTAEIGVGPEFRLAERTAARGGVLLEHGDYEEAIAAFEQSLALRRELLGDEHPFVAGTRSELSQAYLRVGRYEEAEEECLAALRAHEEALGPSHPNTARVHINLADVMLARGKVAEAEAELRTGIAVLTETSPGDPTIALAHNNLGGVFAETDRNEEALTELREGLRLFRAAVGDDHPNVALAHANIAALLSRLGRLDESELEARAAVEGFERSAGPEHPQSAQLRSILADTLVMQKKLADAEQVLREGLVATERAVGATDLRTAWYQSELGVKLTNQGRMSEARPLLEAAWATRERGDVDPVARARTAFSLARAISDDPARARELAITARKALAGQESSSLYKEIDAWVSAGSGAP